jgi:cytosine/adenosine deaminase-related metal-dependent hydrolase
LANGAVAVRDERIVSVGPWATRPAGAPVRDLGDSALLPGLVNAHTHVELSWMGADPPPEGDFMAWLTGFLERRRRFDEEVARREALRAIGEIERRGTVAIGDVGNDTWVWPSLAGSRLAGVLFHEVYDFRSERARDVAASAARRAGALQGAEWTCVAVPHAPHTCSEPLIRALAAGAAERGLPLAIHVAESEAEVSLLRDGKGPFRDLLKARGLWDEGWEPPRTSPLALLDRAGGLGPRTLVVHGVHLGADDPARIRERGATVVTCPRSNARLGVGRAPLGALLASGVPVALGTDSLASAPDLDLFAEMAALRHEHPGLAPATVLRMATLSGATALGLGRKLGSLEPGKLARLVAVPLDLPAADPLEWVTSCPPQVWPLANAPCAEPGAPR